MLLCLACSGTIDKAQDRLGEEAAEAIAERLIGADNVEVDTTTGKVSMRLGDQTFEADNNGLLVTEGASHLAIGDRASIPDTFPVKIPEDAELITVATGTLGPVRMVDVTYRVKGSTLDAEEAKLKEAIGTLGLKVTPLPIQSVRSAMAQSADEKHMVRYGITEEAEGIRIQVTETLQP